jgi:hypothetical protein
MYEVTIEIVVGDKVRKVKGVIEAEDLARASRLVQDEVAKRTHKPSEAAAAKRAEGPLVVMRDGEKPIWIGLDDFNDLAGQTKMPEGGEK